MASAQPKHTLNIATAVVIAHNPKKKRRRKSYHWWIKRLWLTTERPNHFVLFPPFLILIKGLLQDKQCLPTYATVQTVEPTETPATISKRSLTSRFNLCAK